VLRARRLQVAVADRRSAVGVADLSQLVLHGRQTPDVLRIMGIISHRPVNPVRGARDE
jgi:hypothetical protein